MVDRRIVPLGLLLLAVGIAATALLGPLATNTIDYRFSENMERQTMGGDAVLLFVVAPALGLAGYLWIKGRRLAPLLALGAAAYTAYTFLGFILIPDYARYAGNNEAYFPLFVSVLALSVSLGVLAWSALGRQALPEAPRRLRRITAGVLALIALLVGLTWTRQIADVIGGSYSSEYLEHPAAFWLIRTLDFGFVIPAALATAIGLWRGRPAALRSACGLVGFLTLMLAAIAAMAVVLSARDDPAAEPGALAFLIPALAGLALLTWKLWSGGGTPSAPQPGMTEPGELGAQPQR